MAEKNKNPSRKIISEKENINENGVEILQAAATLCYKNRCVAFLVFRLSFILFINMEIIGFQR